MSVSTVINSGQGVVSSNNAAGIALEPNANNSGFRPYKSDLVRAITSLVTLSAGDAGVSTVSSSAAVTIVMPDPSTCLGAEFTVRSLSPHAHILSGSGTMFANNTSTGGQVALANSIGSSVALKSDGLVFLVLGNRGTLTIT